MPDAVSGPALLSAWSEARPLPIPFQDTGDLEPGRLGEGVLLQAHPQPAHHLERGGVVPLSPRQEPAQPQLAEGMRSARELPRVGGEWTDERARYSTDIYGGETD